MNNTAATTKQLDYLLALANTAHGTTWGFLSQLRRIDSRLADRNMSKATASALIGVYVKLAA